MHTNFIFYPFTLLAVAANMVRPICHNEIQYNVYGVQTKKAPLLFFPQLSSTRKKLNTIISNCS